MSELPERTALYRLYDADGVLIYVGISNNPERRWKSHAQDKPWWPEVVEKKVEWFETRKSAARIETTEIGEEDPRHNRTGEKAKKRIEAERAAAYRARTPSRSREVPDTSAWYLICENGEM